MSVAYFDPAHIQGFDEVPFLVIFFCVLTLPEGEVWPCRTQHSFLFGHVCMPKFRCQIPKVYPKVPPFFVDFSVTHAQCGLVAQFLGSSKPSLVQDES